MLANASDALTRVHTTRAVLTFEPAVGFLSLRRSSLRHLLAAFVCTLLFWAPNEASAEVTAATPASFVIRGEIEIAAPPEQVWRRFGRLSSWWASSHTYSGDARNLSLDLRAGGCWCERWDRRQSVEHGRVIMVLQNEDVRTARIQAALGPLQQMGVVAVLTVTISGYNAGTKIVFEYRVTGEPSQNLDRIAAPVDTVLMEQLGRLGGFDGLQ